MPNTYTQIHIHVVFAVQRRQALINKDWRNRLYQYIIGIVEGESHKVLSIGGTEDHIHLFIGLRPDQALSNLVQKIKGHSSRWINDNHLCPVTFSWQSGFGAFSYAKSQMPNVCSYIENQEQHHKKIPFVDEYKEVLKMFDVDFDERFIFKEII